MKIKIREELFKIVDTPLFILAAFAFFLFLRLFQLHADVSPLKNLAELVDEGLWVHNARNMALFGKWTIDQFNQPLIGAPLFNYLLYLVFKFFGTGFFQARLIPALSGWLTLIVVYFIVRQSRSRILSLSCAGLLGSINEFLMYNKVCFPESLQILFYCLMLLSWLLGKRTRAFHVLAGLCFSLAYLAKMSAIYFIPVILLLWAVEWYLDKLEISNIFLFVLGACLVLPWYIPFYLQNIDKFRFLSETIGAANIGGRINILNNILTFPNIYVFGFPSIVLMLYLFIFYAMNFATKSFQGSKNALKSLSSAELMSLAWLIGGTLPLALGPDHAGRRYIMFMVPLSILAVIALASVKDISRNMEQFLKNETANIRPGRFILSVFFTALGIHSLIGAASGSFSLFLSLLALAAIMALIFNKAVFTMRALMIVFTAYLFYSFVQLTGDFLTLSVLLVAIYSLFLAVAIRCKWIDPGSGPYSYLAFFWASFIIIPFLRISASNLFDNSLSVSESFIRPLFIIGTVFFLYLSYLVFFERKLDLVLKTTIAVLIMINIAANSVWLINPSFSMYDASRSIGRVSNKGDVIVGAFAMISAMENQTFPLWWIPNIKYDENLSKINRDNKLMYKARFLIITDGLYKVGEDPKKSGPTVRDAERILKKEPVYLEHFTVIPYKFSDKCWVGLNLIKLKDRI